MSPDERIGSPKTRLRARFLAARRSLDADTRAAAAQALDAAVLALPQVRSARIIAAYESFGTEPATGGLLAALAASGIRVLVPRVLADRDLDWVPYGGGTALGVDALATAEVVIVPALAVDRHGNRLGRGGGSYDRALRRVSPQAVVLALLHDGELVDQLPAEPHDVAVGLAVTPRRIAVSTRARG